MHFSCTYLSRLTRLYTSEPKAILASLPHTPSENIISTLISTIARRLTPQPIKLRTDIELTCYTPAGIDAIKKALRAGEEESNEQVPIRAKLVAPPLYVLSTNSTDKVSQILNLAAVVRKFIAAFLTFRSTPQLSALSAQWSPSKRQSRSKEATWSLK